MNSEQKGDKIKIFLTEARRNLLLLFFAISIGCIYVYPDAKFIYELKDEYRGIGITATSDELIYLGRINTFYKGGDFTLSCFDNYEHKGQPWTFGFLPEVLMGSIGKMLRISVIELKVLMVFFLPVLLFFLIYFLSLTLSNSKSLSLICSASILLSYHLFTGKADILKSVFSLNYAEPLWFLRPISPQFNHVMLISALLFIYIALRSNKKLALWASGIVVGLLFYTFLYYWTFIYAGLFVMASIFIIKREFAYFRKIIFIISSSLIISIPYWINFWKLLHFPNYAVLEELYNVTYTHRPILPLFHIFLTLLILLTYRRVKRGFPFYYIAAFLTGGFVCLNQHVISGKLLIPGHWLGYSNKTFLIIALFISMNNFKDNNIIKKMVKHVFAKRILIGLLLCSQFFLAFSQQNNFLKMHKLFYAQKQSLSSVFMWLRKYTDKNDVILTDPTNYMMKRNYPEIADILVYSHNFSFLPFSINTIRSREEMEDRYIISLTILGYSLDEAKFFFTYCNGVYFLSAGALDEYGGKGMDHKYLAYLEEKYKRLQNKQLLISALKKYRLDYILVDRAEAIKKEALYKHKYLLKIYDNGKFVIFKFSKFT